MKRSRTRASNLNYLEDYEEQNAHGDINRVDDNDAQGAPNREENESFSEWLVKKGLKQAKTIDRGVFFPADDPVPAEEHHEKTGNDTDDDEVAHPYHSFGQFGSGRRRLRFKNIRIGGGRKTRVPVCALCI